MQMIQVAITEGPITCLLPEEGLPGIRSPFRLECLVFRQTPPKSRHSCKTSLQLRAMSPFHPMEERVRWKLSVPQELSRALEMPSHRGSTKVSSSSWSSLGHVPTLWEGKYLEHKHRVLVSPIWNCYSLSQGFVSTGSFPWLFAASKRFWLDSKCQLLAFAQFFQVCHFSSQNYSYY
jgi:hypothetical protein